MKPSNPTLVLISILIIGIGTVSLSANPPPVIEPIHPAILLRAMPKAPAGWKCLASSARNELSGSGIPVTQATRRYEIVIEDKAVNPPVTKTVTCNILVMDIGSKSDTAEDFKSRLLQAEKPDSKRKRLDPGAGTLGSYRVLDGEIIKFDGLCGDRLLIQIEVIGADEKEFEALMKSADFSALATLPRDLPSKETTNSRFTLHIVDEMNPKNSRSYQVGTTDFESESRSSMPETAPGP